jgi:ribosomal protein L11 methyltransferase
MMGTATVVVATDAESTHLVDEIVNVSTWTELRPGRLVAEVVVESDALARLTVRELRAAGHPAVLGPPDDAHRIGWDNRNRATLIDNRLGICFPWSSCAAPVTVEIDPGIGFGTGDHPSTRLVLGELAARLSGGEAVLDVGCGSGVLAVAGLCLGAGEALGIDINVPGLAAAQANAERNGVAGRLELSSAPLSEVTGEFDVVVANIHAPILASMAQDLTRLLSSEGWIALSGISRAQVSKLVAAFPELDFNEPTSDDDWVALVGGFSQR